MKEVIAIISRKGGSGKSTTALCIADQLRQRGESVLLIDLDAQRNTSKATGADLTRPNVTNLFDGAKLGDVVQHTSNGDVVAGSIYLNAADNVLTSNHVLKQALDRVDDYDRIIIDCPASPGRLTMNALTAANSALITVKAEPFSYDGIDELAATIDQAKAANNNLKIRGIIITAYDGRSNEDKRQLDAFRAKAAELGTSVIEPPVRATAKVRAAQGQRVNLSEYAPRCTAAQDYKTITDTLFSK